MERKKDFTIVSKKAAKSMLTLAMALFAILPMTACSKDAAGDALSHGASLVVGRLLDADGSNDDPTAENAERGLSAVGCEPTQTLMDTGLRSSWDEDAAPNYYLVVGNAELPEDMPAPGQVRYHDLDHLGRTQWVDATVTWDMVEASAGWREQFGSNSDPSGWGHNREAEIQLWDGRYYHGWFWNRSHLLADSLGGHAERDNVITGTRMQNVGDNSAAPGGMAYGETLARNWFYEHEGDDAVWLYYRAAPYYVEEELVPRSVVVDMRSSDGSIDLEIVTYNFAKGYVIDYQDGSFSPEG